MSSDPASTARTRLREAVDRAWKVFEHATSARVRIGIGDAGDRERQTRLRSVRLRDWEEQLADDFVLGARAGDVAGLKRVLPQLLELLDPDREACDHGSPLGTDLLIRLGTPAPPQWTEEERRLLADYFAAYGERLIARTPRQAVLVLPHLAEIVDDVRPLLRGLDAVEAAAFVVEWCSVAAANRHADGPVGRQIDAWMKEPDALRRLEAAFGRAPSGSAASDLLPRAIDLLAALQGTAE